ncbi:MAG: hypothetical protein COA79_20370 [Planctomycetota bacterium]|nr:MAG: hypothetical protein COA79_20370 [Planctomycetota bacterium]
MSLQSRFAKEALNSLFINLAEARKVDVGAISVSIGSKKGMPVLCSRVNTKYAEIFELKEHIDLPMLMTGGLAVLEQKIASCSVDFAQELDCEPEEVSLTMWKNGGDFPSAKLLKNNETIRQVDIAHEFLGEPKKTEQEPVT